MQIETILVQAGGKGSRMQELTRNKPKALVPVNNLPMLFHLFRKYPDKKYIIIGDYHYDVLEKYLRAFAYVSYELVCATGQTGTCAGMKKALSFVPDKTPFMLIWCDLILSDDYEMPLDDNDYIGISKDFLCRWKYENGVFEEQSSSTQGVAGHFIFRNKASLSDIPESGEFVRWLQQKNIIFQEFPLWKTHEYGIYSEWSKLPKTRCRPFNKIEFEADRVKKIPLDDQGRALAIREAAWYRELGNLHFNNIPVIYDYEPLVMERISGKNIYEYSSITHDQKRRILSQIISCLKSVHSIGTIPTDKDSYYEAYIGKTFKRLDKVFDLVPFAKNKCVIVNGRKCRNVFYCKDALIRQVMEYLPKQFALIHGDCTFSNLMMKADGTPVLIDPRGYFGFTELYGDPAYDWVKLYYSLFSNYDQFNLKNFHLEIGDNEVRVEIASNHWEDMESDFFSMLESEVTMNQMRLLLAIIWLSLTTYTWEDYDSICSAFYMGLYYLEESLL